MLELRDIHTYYGDSHILQGVSLRVRPGEVVSLLGRNGAGKTTTINTIIGFVQPRRGAIFFEQQDVTRLPSHRKARLGMGLAPQGRRIFSALTVRENILLAARRPLKATKHFDRNNGMGMPWPQSSWDLERVCELFPILRARLQHRGDQLSGGEQQMLTFARALMTNPRLLLLDEPSEGLAPLIVAEIGRVVGQLKGQGLSILLVEQNLTLALEVANRVYVMNRGQIVFEGAPAELDADSQIKHKYLGV